MSAIVAVCAPDARDAEAVESLRRRARRILEATGTRGGEVREERLAAGGAATVVLAAARARWEADLHPAAGHAVADDGGAVADATLYHHGDLARALGIGELPRGAAAAARAAYAAHDEAVFARIEGDFALILWDERRARLLAARDFAGRRPLFYAQIDGTLLLASSVDALLADPAVPRDLDLGTIASVAAGLWCHAPTTAYRAIRELPAGHLLSWEPGHAPVLRRFWEPPRAMPLRRRPLDDAALELRELLVRAVDERLPAGMPTAVSLSGGWDSTAVFGAGQELLRRGPGQGRSLHAVSISYPPGDPGREDELIEAVVRHWQASGTFIDVDAIPLWEAPVDEARRREQPFAHTYEHWNRRLFRAARAAGARVILDGAGGDQLFQVSDIYLSDLLRTGQWLELARQWSTRRPLGWRHLWRWAVRPALPPAAGRAVARARGMTPPGNHFDRHEPGWFRHAFLREHGVLERDAAAAPALPRGVLGELHAYLLYPFFPRVFGLMQGLALDEGLESRSPLLDERVVRFAAARPWSDRVDRRETKIILRRAMRGLLPGEVLAPRPSRTGITTAYFFRQLRGPARPVIDALLQDPLLASLGMIDPARLRHAWAHVQRHDDGETAARIWFTVQAELWVRAHAGGAAA